MILIVACSILFVGVITLYGLMKRQLDKLVQVHDLEGAPPDIEMSGDGKTKARDAIIRIIKYKLDQYLKEQNADFAITPSEKEIN
jgi:hypothetical protein